MRCDVFFVRHDEETGLPILTDQMGFIYTKEDASPVWEGFLRFLEYYSDGKARKHNKDLYEHYFSDMRRKEGKKQKTNKDGYVYFIKAENGLTKIGETISPKSRYSNIKSMVPMYTEFLFAVKTDNAPGLEEKLHEKFSNKREMGEWFRLSEKDIDSTKQHFKSLGYEMVGSEVVG